MQKSCKAAETFAGLEISSSKFILPGLALVFRCPPYFEHSCCPPPPGFGGVRNYWGARQPDAEPAGSERFPQRHLPLTGQPEAFPSHGSAFQNLAGAWGFGVKIGQKLLRQAHSCQDCNLLYLKYVILMSPGAACPWSSQGYYIMSR